MTTNTTKTTVTDDKHLALDADGDVTLPIVELLTGRGFITGKAGSGKSNSASVIIEELLDRGYPVAIIDTDGEYYGLKEEYEVLHVGADEECDLRVGPEHADRLAELALDQNVPLIIDVSGYLDGDTADDVVREFAHALFTKEKKRKQPFLLLVEECHEYIPEGGGLADVGEMLVKIGKRGRKHGLGLAGISQRPADVKKDFITQCDWLLWHRLTWENDTTVVRRVVGSDYADEVPDLGDGEGFLMADFLDADVQRVQVRRKRTFDAGATPGLDDFERPELKSISGDLVDELEEISAAAERRQDRVAHLEAELEAREERIDELEDDLEAERQNNEVVDRLADKLAQAAGGDGGGEALDEIREEKNAEIRALEHDVEEREERITELEAELAEAREELGQRPDLSERAREAVEVLAAEFEVGEEADAALRRKLEQAQERIAELEARDPTPSVEAPDEYDEFVDDEYVRDAIEEAKERANRPRYVKGVVAGILQRGGSVTRRQVLDDLDLSEGTGHHIRDAMKALHAAGIVTLQGSGMDEEADFDFENIEQIHEAQARKQRTEGVMEEL